jgi:hypothetical protein
MSPSFMTCCPPARPWETHCGGQSDCAFGVHHRAGQEGEGDARLPDDNGRNFDEVLRLLDSIQLTAKHTVATPVNWKPGQDVIIPTSVSDDDAKKKYPQGFKTLKPYLRVVSQPK